MPNQERVISFVDCTNVYRRIEEIRKHEGTLSLWPLYFDPVFLSQQLANDRNLGKVMFYCTKPPGWKLQGAQKDIDSYHEQMAYIMKVAGLPGVEVKYGRLKGIRGEHREKGLDTQLSVDMVMMAIREEYDTAILISNDTDYIPAVNGVKELGKKVELHFFKANPCDELKASCNTIIRAKLEYFRELRR